MSPQSKNNDPPMLLDEPKPHVTTSTKSVNGSVNGSVKPKVRRLSSGSFMEQHDNAEESRSLFHVQLDQIATNMGMFPHISTTHMVQTQGNKMRHTLTDRERDEVLSLKQKCDEKGVTYRSIFELAKYCLVVRSQIKDSAKNAEEQRTLLAYKRLKKRRQWELKYQMHDIDNLQALKEIEEAAPGFFVVRYAQDVEGHNVVGHHHAYSPYWFMFASPGNLGKYLAAEQWRLDLGAADLEEARKGIAIVSVADAHWGLAGAYRYLRVLTKARDNVNDMHPNRVRRVYSEIPKLGHHLVEKGKAMLPKKIADRVQLHHDLSVMEQKLVKYDPPITIVEWAMQRNAVYEESAAKVKL